MLLIIGTKHVFFMFYLFSLFYFLTIIDFSRDLTVPGLSSEGLLLKYTRKTQPNLDAEPVFSAR